MWSCYGVHITVCVALLVCILCQPVHSLHEPSLHQLDFFLEIFLWRLQLLLHRSTCLLLLFLFSKNLYYTTITITLFPVIFTITITITYYYYPKSATKYELTIQTSIPKQTLKDYLQVDVLLDGACGLCKKHYCELYNQVHQPVVCVSCGARPKAGKRFSRYLPNPSLVSKLLNHDNSADH